jgi:hypothetical protein
MMHLGTPCSHCFFAAAQAASVPVVGCPSDGQVGPLPAPEAGLRSISIPKSAARRLALYVTGSGDQLLAPRGWHCFGTYGSNGSSIYVSPDSISTRDFFDTRARWRGLTGYGMQATTGLGGTSGRFTVARLVARLFPKYKGFAKRVIAEGLEPASSFPAGPYSNDKLTYRSNELVEFVTPPGVEGFGTHSWLVANDRPIEGFVVLSGSGGQTDFSTPSIEINTLYVAFRLPPGLQPLASIIKRQLEQAAAKAD